MCGSIGQIASAIFYSDYVPAEMTAYGVFRLQLMTYDVQWHATYFLSKSAVCADCVILAQHATYV